MGARSDSDDLWVTEGGRRRRVTTPTQRDAARSAFDCMAGRALTGLLADTDLFEGREHRSKIQRMTLRERRAWVAELAYDYAEAMFNEGDKRERLGRIPGLSSTTPYDDQDQT